ncbi:hypothetical protein ACPA9J_25505 [Pseudomonas aeruginosa]
MTATTLRPELLCPAGTLKSMRYAFAYGADAAYAGQPRYRPAGCATTISTTPNWPKASPRPTHLASASTWWSTSPRTTPS